MRHFVRVLALCLAATAFVQCDDDSGPPLEDAGADLSVSNVDMAGTTLMACLDRPDEELPRPPGNTLPCELIPPGLTL